LTSGWRFGKPQPIKSDRWSKKGQVGNGEPGRISNLATIVSSL